jgi:hypothetical protein
MKIKIIAFLLNIISKCLKWSYRFPKPIGLDEYEKAKMFHPKGSLCAALWHETFFPLALFHAGEEFSPIVSQSKDGELITYVLKRLGFNPVRGSSSRGGPKAKIELQKAIQKGKLTGITVDGPKGPRREIKPGIISIAKEEQVMIIPFSCAVKDYWEFNSWDKFKLPKPFTKIQVSYGKGVTVPKDVTRDEYSVYSDLLKFEIDQAEIKAQNELKKI